MANNSLTDYFLETFGLRLAQEKEPKEVQNSIVEKPDDGAVVLDDTSPTGANTFSLGISFEEAFTSQTRRIEFYREMAENPFVADAVKEILNDAIVSSKSDVVTLNLEKTEFSEKIKQSLVEEFEGLTAMLEFPYRAYDIFEKWYVDGQYAVYKIVKKEKTDEGIVALREIDTRFLRRVVDIKRDPQTNKITSREEYFIYGEPRTKDRRSKGIRLNKDSVAYVDSGKYDKERKVVSYLEKAIVPYNQLNNLEVAILIYFISRAPERLVFYVDTGTLPPTAANQYMKKIANKYENKTIYDIRDGTIKNNKQIRTILENYWLPRQEGSRGTEISSVGGSATLDQQLEVVNRFERKLYKSLNIPLSRLEAQQNFQFGRASEITRDELNFQKFIDRIHLKFSFLFYDLLKTQCVLKNIVSEDEWEENKNGIYFEYATDSVFEETKDAEIWETRMRLLDMASQHVKKNGYFSQDYIRKNILRLSEDEIEEINKQNEEDEKAGKFKDQDDQGGF